MKKKLINIRTFTSYFISLLVINPTGFSSNFSDIYITHTALHFRFTNTQILVSQFA